MLVLQQMTVCWPPLPDASSQGWGESPPRCEGRPGGWLLHRSQASPKKNTHTQIHKQSVHKKKKPYIVKCVYTCGGHCGGRCSPWWHVPGTQGWRGSLVWSHSLYCSGKGWAAQGPAQTVCHRQIPHCSIAVYTRHGFPNIAHGHKINLLIIHLQISPATVWFIGSCLKVNCGLLQSVAKQQVKPPVPARWKCATKDLSWFSLCTCVTYSNSTIVKQQHRKQYHCCLYQSVIMHDKYRVTTSTSNLL